MLAMVALLVLLSVDLLAMLGGYGAVTGGLVRQSPLGIAAAFGLVGLGAWLVWKAWHSRERLLEPLGLVNTGESPTKTLSQLGTTLLMVLVIRLVFQGMVVGSALVSQFAEMVRFSGVLLFILLLGMAAFWLKFKDAWNPSGGMHPVLVSPPEVRRMGWWFVAFGLVSFLPTVLLWGSSIRVWHPGSLLTVVGVAVLTQSRLWRAIAVGVCSVLAVLGLWGLAAIPALVASIHHPDLTRGPSANVSPAELLAAAAQWLVFVGGLLFLNRRDVRATFGLEATTAQELTPNPWPHRLFWVILGPVLLVGSALIAGLLAPALQMSNGPVSGAAAGLIPLATGAMVAWLFWRTRPTPERAQPRSQWNPWPQRIFWAVVSVLLVPAFLLLVGLAVPRMMARSLPPGPGAAVAPAIQPGLPQPVFMGNPQFLGSPAEPLSAADRTGFPEVQLEQANRAADPERVRLLWRVQSDEPGRVKVSYRGRWSSVALSRAPDQMRFTAQIFVSVQSDPAEESQLKVQLSSGDQRSRFSEPLDLSAPVELGSVLAQAQENSAMVLGADRSAVLTRVEGETLTLEFLKGAPEVVPAFSVVTDRSQAPRFSREVAPTSVRLEQSDREANPESTRLVWRVQSDQPGQVTVRFRDSRAEVELARLSGGDRFGARISFAAMAKSPREGLVAVQLVAGDQQNRFDVPLDGSVPLELDQVLTQAQVKELLPLSDSGPVTLTSAASEPLTLTFEKTRTEP